MAKDFPNYPRLQKALAGVLNVPVETIALDSSMDNLAAWDSLRFLEVITATEQAFGVRFRTAQLKRMVSVRNILEELENGQRE